MDADYYIQHLRLQPHPEGGFFRETYRAREGVEAGSLPARFAANRSFSTAIFYLLRAGEFSMFHRIKSDECWHFYAGGTLLIHMIGNTGSYSCVHLGGNLAEGENFQFVVPAGTWFGSEPAGGQFSLAGCTVAPGFDFADFEMASRAELSASFPQHADIILRLSRECSKNSAKLSE